MNNQVEDNQLIEAIAHGNRMAFELLYERYFDRITTFSNGFLHDKNLAEDVAQEVFLQIIHQPEKFDLNKTFSTWIFTIAANKCKNQLRDRGNRNRILNSFYEENIFELKESLDTQPIIHQIHHLIKDFSPKDQQIFQLRFQLEISVKQIAKVMDIPEGSVKSGIYYLLKKLAKKLKLLNYEYK